MIKREIVIETGMVRPVSSERWKARLQATILKMSPHSPHPPPNCGSRACQNLGFGIRDSGFGIRDTGLRIPLQWNLDSGFQSLYRFQSPGFRTPQAKSRFSYIGRHSSTSFLSSIPPLKTLKTI